MKLIKLKPAIETEHLGETELEPESKRSSSEYS